MVQQLLVAWQEGLATHTKFKINVVLIILVAIAIGIQILIHLFVQIKHVPQQIFNLILIMKNAIHI
jgi:uncharacterized membrane protein YbaN (DUF454 family)